MSRVRTALAGLALAAVAVFVAPSAAFAHDELLESSPADGEVVTAVPEAIELTFSAEIQELGAMVVVAAPDLSDADRAAQSDTLVTDIVIERDVLRAALDEAMPAGEYRVDWRVVSSDGHPIDGTFTFTLETEAAEPTTEPTTDPTAEAVPDPTQDAEEIVVTSEEDQAAGTATMWLIVAVVAILALIALITAAILRGRSKGKPGDAPQSTPGGTPEA